MKEYQKIFFYEIKLLPSYFIEFFKDDTISSKEYISDYVIRKPEKRLIIMITHDKNTFFANNRYKKV